VLATALPALSGGFVSSLWAAQPDLASADWSVNAAHNLTANPPSLDAVEDFERRFLGASEEEAKEFGDNVCEFRFADLRSSGNLSLTMTVDGGGTGGCNLFYIFDRTPKGFELYDANAVGHDLAHSVLDIKHDGRHVFSVNYSCRLTTTILAGCRQV
jgi:hypothetical protein